MSRARGKVETTEYAKFARRILRGYGKRIADADIEDLAELIKLRAEVDAVIADAIATGRKRWEWSWTDIARAAGVTREAAWKRWGKGKPEMPESRHVHATCGTHVRPSLPEDLPYGVTTVDYPWFCPRDLLCLSDAAVRELEPAG